MNKLEIQNKAGEFLKEVNPNLPEDMELEFEGFFDRGFFLTKKRYALLEDENIVVKGLELVRRDWPPCCQENPGKGMVLPRKRLRL